MLQLKNNTPFAVKLAAFPNEEGIDSLVVVVKGSFELRDSSKIRTTQLPVSVGDEYWGEPGGSSLKEANELHLHKAITDILVTGHAGMPDRREFELGKFRLWVGDRSVFEADFYGHERRYRGRGGKIDVGRSVPKVPLCWEETFGGVSPEEKDPSRRVFSQNPVGRGYLGTRNEKSLAEMLAPSIVQPGRGSFEAMSSAGALGTSFVSPTWDARLPYAGTYDQAWQKRRAPFLPKDYSQKYQQTAPRALQLKVPPRAGTPMVIQGLYGIPKTRIAMPAQQAKISVTVKKKEAKVETRLETIRIDGDQEALTLTWRAVLPCDRKLHDVDSVTIDAEGF